MGQFNRPGEPWKNVAPIVVPQPVPYKGRPWKLTCEVDSVSIDRKAISLWVLGLDGTDDSVEIPIPDNMPGWALRPGVAFVGTIPWDQRYYTNVAEVEWLDFSPLEYGYLSEEELISLLAQQP